MSEEKFKTITLQPFKAISFYGFGESPEDLAHQAANKWLEEHDLQTENAYRHFGFNNPNPSHGSPNYGYEIWIVPNQEFSPDPDDKVIDFEGGLYAITYCPSLDVIGQTWQELVNWRDTNGYFHASHQWLEGLHTPWKKNRTNFEFTLYLPIKK